MRQAIVFAVIAAVFYAGEIVITDLKLSRISPRLLTFMYATGVAILVGASLLLYPEKDLSFPQGKEWGLVSLMVGVSFIAATAHFVALHEHTGAATMCTYYSLLPVIASGLIFIFSTREVPSGRIILAWLLGALAVYLIVTATKK